MTNTPEPMPAPSHTPTESGALDAGTFDRLVEPRSDARLALDGTWHQISRKYITVQLIATLLFVAVLVAAAVAVWIFSAQWWPLIPLGGALVITLATLVVMPRQARAIGYMLREDDLVFRKGILWQRIVAVPYGRLQLVDITHGPLDRGFGIAQLKLVTAASATGVSIPGLTQAAAEELRDTLVDVAETRRTGL